LVVAAFVAAFFDLSSSLFLGVLFRTVERRTFEKQFHPMPSSTVWLAALLGAGSTGASYAGIILRGAHDAAAEGHFPPATAMASGELPDAFSWREVDGVGSLLTVGGNQHIPHYCGACYAFGALHVLQDRVKVARFLMDREWRLDPANTPKKGQRDMSEHKEGKDSHAPLRDPDLIASVQVLLNCFNDKACHGGSTASAWAWAKAFPGGGVPVLVRGTLARSAHALSSVRADNQSLDLSALALDFINTLKPPLSMSL
jgi:hypothetical protein